MITRDAHEPSFLTSALWAARLLLAVAFVYSGVSKLLNFDAAVGEAAHFGLSPAPVFAAAVLITQLAGTALMLFGRGLWAALGALALAGFTVVATAIGHPFWVMSGMEQFHNRNSFLEHLGLVGGLVLVAALSWDRRAAR
jgi:transmembrane protein